MKESNRCRRAIRCCLQSYTLGKRSEPQRNLGSYPKQASGFEMSDPEKTRTSEEEEEVVVF
jgi:hypothetical protein